MAYQGFRPDSSDRSRIGPALLRDADTVKFDN